MITSDSVESFIAPVQTPVPVMLIPPIIITFDPQVNETFPISHRADRECK